MKSKYKHELYGSSNELNVAPPHKKIYSVTYEHKECVIRIENHGLFGSQRQNVEKHMLKDAR